MKRPAKKRRAPKQRFWCNVQSPLGEMRVFVTRGALIDEEDGTELDGECDPDKKTIRICHTPNVTLMKMKLHHELTHLAVAPASGDLRKTLLGGSTYERRYKREEHIVSFLEIEQFDLLNRNGFIKYPNPPRMR